MSAGADEVRDLIYRGWNLPDGPGQIAAAEEAIRHADALADQTLAFDARMLATSAYHRGGEPAKAFVTFSWCLSAYDADPADHDVADDRLLRWFFKYVVSSLPRFPQIPLERTRSVLDDMQRRYLAGGHSLHAVYNLRWLLARHTGDIAAADQWYARWCAAPRDENSDCAGCDPTEKVVHLRDRGRHAEAVELAEPVLAGQLTCVEQPHSMLTELLLPYLYTGQLGQARDAHRRAYRARRGNVANMIDVAAHIVFCARTGNEARGLEIVQRHLEWLDRPPSPYAAMEFASAAGLTLRRLAEAGHGGLVVLRRGADDVPVARLAEELAGAAIDLAAQFDSRNGGTYQSRRIADLLVAEPIVEHLSLSPSTRRRTTTAVGGGAPAPRTELTAASRLGAGAAGPDAMIAPGAARGTAVDAGVDAAQGGSSTPSGAPVEGTPTLDSGAAKGAAMGNGSAGAGGSGTGGAGSGGTGGFGGADGSDGTAGSGGTAGTAGSGGTGGSAAPPGPDPRAGRLGAGRVVAAADTGALVPQGASPEELLDLAERYGRTDRSGAARAVLRAFDERYGDSELPPILVARRADARGNELAERRDVAGAEQAWRMAVDAYRAAGDQLREHVALGRLGVLLCLADRTEEGFPLVERSREHVLAHGTPERRAGARSRFGIALVAAGRSSEALAEFEDAAREASQIDDSYLRADIALRRAHCLSGLSRPEEFRAAALHARELFRELGGDGLAMASLLYGTSFDMDLDGEREQALEAFDEAVRVASPGRASVEPRLARGRALCALERAEEAIDDFVEVVALCTELDMPDGAAFTRFELAGAYRQAGRPLEAAEVGEEAVTALSGLGELQAADRCRYLLSWTYRDLDEEDAALAMLDDLAANLDGYDNLPARGQMLEEAGDLLYQLDRDGEAADRFLAAATAFARAGLLLDELRARRRHAVALRWAGDFDTALAALAEVDSLAGMMPVDVAEQPQGIWEQAMLRYDGAKVLVAVDRFEEAHARLNGVPGRLREIDAFGEALLAELLLGELLLRMERPTDAEPMLRSVLTGLPRDAEPLPQAAWLLSQALAMQGRDSEAKAVRAEYGIGDDRDTGEDGTN